MLKVLITGSNGFIGKNLKENLRLRTELELLLFDLPQTMEDLRQLVLDADIVFHLAGVNRPTDQEDFKSGNIDLTRALLEMLEKDNRKTPLVMSSSTQAELDNPYGRSKKEAEDLVFAYANRSGAPVYVYRLPNVFGKWCRPNYNSVVATFCHNAANKISLRIDEPDKIITLLYIDDVVEEFLLVIEGQRSTNAGATLSVSPTYDITVGDLAARIARFADSRRTLLMDSDMSDVFTQKLYATFLSYSAVDDFAIKALMRHDERGFFAELVKSTCFGQISVSRTKPGVTRGNHWHNSKIEKFIVIEGRAVIRLRKVGTDEVLEYQVSGEELKVVDMPPGYTHSIQNIGDADVLTIFWANEIYDPDNPDTNFEKV